MALLSVKDLRVSFHTRNGIVRAVNGLSYDLERGETLGIVGESGSGKSVAQYALLGLVPMPPGRIEGGRALFDGHDLLKLPRAALRQIRGKRIAMIFQDPMSALNPYMTIGRQLIEPLLVHERCSRADARKRAVEALTLVGIPDPARRLGMYPHEFSGGMRQRVMIAMALITRPDILIADEPTTALDVTVQAQILQLIKKAQEELGMALILITHDLGVIAGTCDRVLVMYAGRILEAAATEPLYYASRHPYTRALMASMPSAHEAGETLYTIPGLPPDLSQEISGCPFAPRCPFTLPHCTTCGCDLLEVAPGQFSACVRVQEGSLGPAELDALSSGHAGAALAG
jgi:oligopeptide transport system ATP-binding protein